MPAHSGPATIGRYEVVGLIARGGMGRLYLARDPNMTRLVVIKLLDATLDSTELRERFDREARALGSLSHANIVHIFDYGDFEDSPFIAMEFIRGETLEEKIGRRASLTVAQRLRLMVDLCAGLAHAHEAGIIHRDVKPANLMVDQDHRLKILDFGIARVADSSLTRVGTRASLMQMQIGTPGYMSPEQTEGGEVDPRTDIFAVGAVCYELFAQREAFPGATPEEIEAAVMGSEPPLLSEIVPGLDPEIDDIIRRALAKDRNQRFPDAKALGRALERCRTRINPLNTPPPAPRDPSSITMAGIPGRENTAYARAVAAYNQKAMNLARRCALEALAENPNHAEARALLAAIESLRPGVAPPPLAPPARPVRAAPPPAPVSRPPAHSAPPSRMAPEPISTDPTVLISRASLGVPASTHSDPTVLIRREDIPRATRTTDETMVMTPGKARGRVEENDDEPLTIATPASKVGRPSPAPSRKPSPSPLLALAPLWQRIKSLGGPRQAPKPSNVRAGGRGVPPPSRSRAGAFGLLSSGTMRGGLLAAAGVAVAALAVFAVILLMRWLSPPGQLLTVTRPINGTLIGPDLECGSRGSDCTASIPTGEPVQLQTVADTGFVFSGWVGDCAPTGSLVMTAPRACGAVFEQVAPLEPTRPTWSLRIDKPTGGTVDFEGQILCGSLGAMCEAQIADAQPVALRSVPEPGYVFVRYTGDCSADGLTQMTQARTCGAMFAPEPRMASPEPAPRPRTQIAARPPQPAPAPPPEPQAPPPVVAVAAPPPVQAPLATAPLAEKPTITPDDHAKNEITLLVKQYCQAMETLKEAQVQKVHPQVDLRQFRQRFRQYKSLVCSITKAPEYDRLDAGPAGGAQIKFEMKQVLVMQSGGAQQTLETIVTATLSRASFRDPWLFDKVAHREKPKD